MGISNKHLEQSYSADIQKSAYTKHETNSIYVVNHYLGLLYYVLLIVYIYYNYEKLMYSSHFYRNLFILLLLLAYPYIIYPIQYFIYSIILFILRIFYSNIYKTEHW